MWCSPQALQVCRVFWVHVGVLYVRSGHCSWPWVPQLLVDRFHPWDYMDVQQLCRALEHGSPLMCLSTVGVVCPCPAYSPRTTIVGSFLMLWAAICHCWSTWNRSIGRPTLLINQGGRGSLSSLHRVSCSPLQEV